MTDLIFIAGIVNAFCAYYCYEWGKELGKKGYVAAGIGFLFGLPGLLGYWVYFSSKKYQTSTNQKEALRMP